MDSKKKNIEHKPLKPDENSGWSALKALVDGFATTARHLGRKPITESYPEFKRQLPERSRARIVLTRDPDGRERCVACYLCSAACPVSCISMQSAEKENGRRYARWFRINFGRCIYCGLDHERLALDDPPPRDEPPRVVSWSRLRRYKTSLRSRQSEFGSAPAV